MKKKFILLIIMTCLLVALPVASCQQQAITAGNPAPDFELLNLEGESISLSSLEGRPVILNFWALDCPYCLDEMPYFEMAHNTYGNGEGMLVVLAVNVRDSSSAIEGFLHQKRYSFEFLRDTGNRVANLYLVSGLPVTILIDKNGIIQDVVIGAFANWATLKNRLARIIE